MNKYKIFMNEINEHKIIKGGFSRSGWSFMATTGYYTMVKFNLPADTPTTATISTSTKFRK